MELLILSFLLVLFYFNEVITTTFAFSAGAGSCSSGAVTESKVSGSAHLTATTKSLAKGNFQIFLNGKTVLVPNQAANIDTLTPYTLSIVPSNGAVFRGALIRTEGYAAWLEPGTNSASSLPCQVIRDVDGITHFNSDTKTEFTAVFQVDDQSEATIDVTIVVSLKDANNYHDTFFVRASDAENAPMDPPTVKPVTVPRTVVTPAPIARPTVPPVRAPRVTPVVRPVITPTVPPVSLPVQAPKVTPTVLPATEPTVTQVGSPTKPSTVSTVQEGSPMGTPVQFSAVPGVAPVIFAPTISSNAAPTSSNVATDISPTSSNMTTGIAPTASNLTADTAPTVSNLITNTPTYSSLTIDTPLTISNTTVDIPSDKSTSGEPSQLSSCTLRNKCMLMNLIGECCPTTEGWMLDCCEDSDDQYQHACSSHPECDRLGIDDACCPTADGKWLDCCSTVPDECQEAGKCPLYSSVRYALKLDKAKNSKSSPNDKGNASPIGVAAVVGIVGGGVFCLLVLGFITFRTATKVATIGLEPRSVTDEPSDSATSRDLHDPDLPSTPTVRHDLLPTGGSISVVDNTNQPPFQIPISASRATSMFLPLPHPRYVVGYKDQSRSVMWQPKHVSMINGVPVQSTIPMVIAREITTDGYRANLPKPTSSAKRHRSEA
jgi:hypothetical protein